MGGHCSLVVAARRGNVLVISEICYVRQQDGAPSSHFAEGCDPAFVEGDASVRGSKPGSKSHSPPSPRKCSMCNHQVAVQLMNLQHSSVALSAAFCMKHNLQPQSPNSKTVLNVCFRYVAPSSTPRVALISDDDRAAVCKCTNAQMNASILGAY